MNSVQDFNSVDSSHLTLKTRGPSYNGIETFDVEYDEQGPLYLANAVPVVIVKGVRTDSEGREFVIFSQKNVTNEIVKTLNEVVEQLSIQSLALMGYTPLFAGDSGAFGLSHDFKMYDPAGKPLEDYKNLSGHYRVMFVFDTAVIRDCLLTATPKIQQLQYVEGLQQVFDHCYWLPPLTIKVRKNVKPKQQKRTSKKPAKPLTERRVRKQRVQGKVDPSSGFGLDKSANIP